MKKKPSKTDLDARTWWLNADDLKKLDGEDTDIQTFAHLLGYDNWKLDNALQFKIAYLYELYMYCKQIDMEIHQACSCVNMIHLLMERAIGNNSQGIQMDMASAATELMSALTSALLTKNSPQSSAGMKKEKPIEIELKLSVYQTEKLHEFVGSTFFQHYRLVMSALTTVGMPSITENRKHIELPTPLLPLRESQRLEDIELQEKRLKEQRERELLEEHMRQPVDKLTFLSNSEIKDNVIDCIDVMMTNLQQILEMEGQKRKDQLLKQYEAKEALLKQNEMGLKLLDTKGSLTKLNESTVKFADQKE
ncbi:hypothetical protein EDD86DRAFT_215387 [Gorgonomyces haynaldii]|nr:hypothetical protein EDD86DRAFT_215387 [Gorgonomyces haynaldii]